VKKRNGREKLQHLKEIPGDGGCWGGTDTSPDDPGDEHGRGRQWQQQQEEGFDGLGGHSNNQEYGEHTRRTTPSSRNSTTTSMATTNNSSRIRTFIKRGATTTRNPSSTRRIDELIMKRTSYLSYCAIFVRFTTIS